MKKVLSILPVALLLLLSCSSDNNTSNNNPSNPSGGLLIKELIFSNDVALHFEYNGNKLSKGTGTDGSHGTYTYNGDLISQINYYDINNSLLMVRNFYYVNNELVKSTLVEANNRSSQTDYVYSSGGKVILNSKSTDQNGTISYGTENYYYLNGNIVNIESNGKIESYSYDTKNSPWKNITGYLQLNSILSFGEYFLINTNNALTVINPQRSNLQNPINFSYQYNSQDYPISCTQSQTGQPSFTVNYTYY